MKTNQSAIFRAFWLGFVLLNSLHSLRADEFGLFTYYVNAEGTAVITNHRSSAAGPVEIPAEIAGKPVTGIDEYAFRRHTGISSVTIPPSVKFIGFSAFWGCSSLNGITIPSSVTSIGAYAFTGCSSLQSISVEPGNPQFSSPGGMLCNAAQTNLIQYPAGKAGACVIPSGIQDITHYALYDCPGVTSVSIPASAGTIGWGAFHGCNNLQAITVAPENPAYVSVAGVLFNKAETQLLVYPAQKAGAYTIPSSVRFIGYYAFGGCTGLTGITIPSSVTGLDVGIFTGCTGLTNIALPSGITRIYEYTFSGCTGLTSVTLPISLVSIHSGAFYGCTALTGLTIPSGVTSIGELTFAFCAGLSSITLPAGVTSVGEQAFLGCAGLTGIVLPAGVTAIGDGAFNGCSSLNAITIPAGLTSIGEGAFSGCSNLNTIAIPASVTIIGDYAFSNCTGLTSFSIQSGLAYFDEGVFAGCSSLTSITIPPSITSISSDAFGECTGLTSVTIPSTVTYVSGDAFYSCTGLQSIMVAPGNPNYVSVEGVLFNKLQTELILYPAGRGGIYTIPSGITSIDFEFSGCTGLTGINIPPGVTSIYGGAFWGCNSLQSIMVDSGNTHYVSRGGVLFDAARATLIQYPPGKTGPFGIPAGVTSVGGAAFGSCTLLTSVNFPPDVASIGESAFRNCSGLSSVTFSFGLTEISQLAFEGCQGLTSITLPPSLTKLDGWAFGDCPGLNKAVFTGDAPAINIQPFANNAPGFTVYYLSSRTGFTSPVWTPAPGQSYPSTLINEAAFPAASWLLTHGFWYDTGLHQDPDGDGVDLRMAYALDLDPRLNLQASLPLPVRIGNTLSLSYHATSPGITYRVETSIDLLSWTTTGVTQSAPGPDHRSTASVPFNTSHRFLRLAVEN